MHRRALVVVTVALAGFAIASCSSGGSGGSPGTGSQAYSGVICEKVTCPQLCCPGGSCAPSSVGCGDFFMACDGPEDCPAGQVCCIGIGAHYGSADCENPADCGQSFQQVACHTTADCPVGTCQQSQYSDVFVSTLRGCQ